MPASKTDTKTGNKTAVAAPAARDLTTLKTNLLDNTDLTAERDDFVYPDDDPDPAKRGKSSRTGEPPATAEERIADRADWVPAYGSAPVPPAPRWFQSQGVGSRPVTGGRGSGHEISLAWTSGVGAIPKGSKTPPLTPVPNGDPVNAGARGLDSIGIGEHRLYVGAPAPAPPDGTTPPAGDVPPPPATPTMVLTGAGTTVHFDGYFLPAVDPAPPVWTPIAANKVYAVQVAAVSADGVEGARSEVLVVNTHARVDPDELDDVVPPLAPPDFQLLRMPDMAAPSPKVKVSWRPVPNAAGYEVYLRVVGTGAAGMDPTRPGLLTGDVLAGTAPQPAVPGAVVEFEIPVSRPNAQHTLKVRSKRVAVREGEDETKFSPCTELTVRTAAVA
ncbi:hypothetical protein [Streptomyces sp. AP-93]|uniref:hypothetical protein n=1 Tax=Streptomyces sp. AP-93 TaxID=2929048 RepID=UPI001FAFBB38|nr:hypothetical protein [Streptomyces sp. AP-93]MCJ0868124.1 hypothetical protein [Streptomyces sp. AP-93]